MEFETMEQVSDTSSYASTEGYYQGQGGYLAHPQYPDASYYTGGGAYAQSTESDSHSHDSYESYGSYQKKKKKKKKKRRPGAADLGGKGFSPLRSSWKAENREEGGCEPKKTQADLWIGYVLKGIRQG
ncbi:hypothetical protein Taro_016318 [Colocasia esculenta]|uniref:Uncharacterized protein n=1 Tax=Colocasia esculenta TaxID=4460 RepID=A0A843UPW2_COLES|nr:hypothetical protein [Colocasia esculenta]